MTRCRIFPFVGAVAALALFCGCTESPFGANEITPGRSELRGTVVLSDSLPGEDVYVWLEEFNLSTRTDAQGHFSLQLPPPETQGPPDGVTGAFNLYYYVANYELNSTRVATRDGEFVYPLGEVNSHGELSQPKVLQKFLDIVVEVDPAAVSQSFSGEVTVRLRLRTSKEDSATVVFPNRFARPQGTLILRAMATGEIFVFSSVKGEEIRQPWIVGNAGDSREMAFEVKAGALPVGRYEVIPHILIKHEEIPQALLESLGGNFEQPGENYLKIPMLRREGKFEVTP